MIQPFGGRRAFLTLLKHTTQVARARIPVVEHKIDIHTLKAEAASTLAINEIGVLEVETSKPLFVDTYKANRTMGSFILINPGSNATVGAGMIRRVMNGAVATASSHPRATRAAALVNVGDEVL